MAAPAQAAKSKRELKPKSRQPFYILPTDVKEDYSTRAGTPEQVELQLVTLPPGTVLFRGVKLPDVGSGGDARWFFRDYLGDPEGPSNVCLSPTHNVFFYAQPYVSFGISDVGTTYHAIQVVVLVKPVTVISNISPSKFVRGRAKAYDGTAPYQRCPNFNYDCHEPSERELEGKKFDNCIHPLYASKSGVRGWMAIANWDSLNPNRVQEGKEAKDARMSAYLRGLDERIPGLGAELVASSYTDFNRHAGFPEIVLYPYAKHLGEKLIVRKCRTVDDCLRIMEREEKYLNLNYLPLATITKDATADMVNGYFSMEPLAVRANVFSSAPEATQAAIELRLRDYLTRLETEGLRLPFYGAGRLTMDSRTGFLCLQQVVPKSVRVPLPASEASTGGAGATEVPYSSLLLPLGSVENKLRAMTYSIMFRSFLKEKFMNKYPILKGFAARRAMVFNRPPDLAKLFKLLEMPMPREYGEAFVRAAKLYQKETGRVPQTRDEAEAEAEVVTVMPSGAAGAAPAGRNSAAGAEGEGASSGGSRRRKTKHARSKGRRSTRRNSGNGGPHPMTKIARSFQRMWELHARAAEHTT